MGSSACPTKTWDDASYKWQKHQEEGDAEEKLKFYDLLLILLL